MTVTPSEPKTVNSGTMTNLSSANINKLQTNKEKLSIELQNKISNFTEQTKTMSMVEDNSQVTKNKLTELTAERNAALNGLAKYSKTLAKVMNSKKINANTISDLQSRLTELQGISNATKKELSDQINKLKQNRNAAVALVNQLESNKAELSNLVGKFQKEISNSKISNAELKTKLTTILSQRNSIQQKLNESIKKGALTQQEINNLRKSTSKERESLLAQVRNAQEILKRLQNEKKEKNQKNAALVALRTNLNKILSLNKIASYKINNKYKNNDNFKRAVTSRKSTLLYNELMPKISSATLQNINKLNLKKYNNIESKVKAAINKRKVELYKSELAKRNTNLTNLRNKLARIPPGTEGKQNLSTKIKAEEERRVRVADALTFRKMINANLEKNIPQTIKNQIQTLKTKLPQNDDLLFENLTTYEDNYREIFGKPKKFIFFNKVPESGNGIFKAANMTIPKIQTFKLGPMGNKFNKNLKDDFAIINSSFGTNSTNVFFVGPSGSGKTTLFKQYTNSTDLKTLSGITVYKPNLNYDVCQGILYFSDEVINNYNYSQFASEFIRPTPFNPQSSRAHMSIMSGEKNGEKRRVFDLAGKESPVAISELALGFNAFDGEYWNLDQSFENLIKSKKSYRLIYLLKIIGLNVKELTDLDKIIVGFIYKNFFYNSYNTKRFLTSGSDGIRLFTNILKENQEAKLTEYFGSATNKSKIMDINFIINYDSYKAQIVEDFGLSNKIPKDLQGNTTVVRYIFEMMKRVFEGVYITRSLFSLGPLFKGNSNQKELNKFKNIINKTNSHRITGVNVNAVPGIYLKSLGIVNACTNIKGNKGTIVPGFGLKVKVKPGVAQTKNELYKQTQKNIKNNKAKNNFVVLPPATEFKYKTSFYDAIVAKKDFKNCLIGVISDFETLDSKIKQQKQSLEFFKKI